MFQPINNFIFKGESINNKNILISPLTYKMNQEKGELIVLSSKGKILNYNLIPYQAIGFSQPIAKRYSYCILDEPAPKNVNGFIECGTLHLTDENFNIINKIRMKKFGSYKQEGNPVSGHGYYFFNDNHYIVFGNQPAILKLKNGEEIMTINCIIQEQKDDKVIWQFETNDYPELFSYALIKNKNITNIYTDYAHLNCIIPSKDNKFLYLSYRNIGIIKIEKDTKKFKWVFGKGYTNLILPKEINLNNIFCFQHDIRLFNEDEFTLFNNNDGPTDENKANPQIKSQVIYCKIKDKKIEKYNIYNTTHIASRSMGGAIPIEQDVFDISYGSFRTGINAEEYNFKEQKQYMSIQFDTNAFMYRMEREI